MAYVVDIPHSVVVIPGAIVNADSCAVNADDCVVNGDRCWVTGANCIINGDDCVILGSGATVHGKCLTSGPLAREAPPSTALSCVPHKRGPPLVYDLLLLAAVCALAAAPCWMAWCKFRPV